MSRLPLAEADDWQLVDDDQDIRGWPLRDLNNRKIGTIDDLIADTEEEQIVAVRLDTGAELAAEDLNITEDAVYVTGKIPAALAVRRYRPYKVRRQ